MLTLRLTAVLIERDYRSGCWIVWVASGCSASARRQLTAARNRFVCLSIRARFECVVMLSCRWYSTLANCKRTQRRSVSFALPLSSALTPGGPWARTDKGGPNKHSQNKNKTDPARSVLSPINGAALSQSGPKTCCCCCLSHSRGRTEQIN